MKLRVYINYIILHACVCIGWGGGDKKKKKKNGLLRRKTHSQLTILSTGKIAQKLTDKRSKCIILQVVEEPIIDCMEYVPVINQIIYEDDPLEDQLLKREREYIQRTKQTQNSRAWDRGLGNETTNHSTSKRSICMRKQNCTSFNTFVY